MCVRGSNFTSSYDFAIGFWNCSDNVVFLFYNVNSECYDCYLQTIYGSHLEIVENAGHMVMMETPDRFNQLLYNFITEQPLDTIHTDPDTHRIDIEDEHIHTRWSNLDDEYSQLSLRAMVKSQVSLHSIRSCKSSKSMPHGLLSSSVK